MDENTAAISAQEAEMKKIGLVPHSERIKRGKEVSEESEDSEDMGYLDENDPSAPLSEEEKDSEDKDDSEDSDSDHDKDDKEDDDTEDPDSDADDQTYRKGFPFKVFNKTRSELRELQGKLKEMADKNAELESKLPDDFQERVTALAKEIGVENPDGLIKITSFMKEVTKGQTAGLEKKLADLEAKFSETTKVDPMKLDEFPTEWKTFVENDMKKYFPNATPAELKDAEKLMNDLSHTKGVGGKTYFDENGNELIDPYSLDYLMFNHKDKFEKLLTTRKSRGMEDNKTQNYDSSRDNSSEMPVLPKNPTMAQIKAYEMKSSRAIADGDDNLRSPIDNSI